MNNDLCKFDVHDVTLFTISFCAKMTPTETGCMVFRKLVQITLKTQVLVRECQQGYRPATIEELLAFGEAHPNLQKRFLIFALGSIWQDTYNSRRAPYLWSRVAGGRLLSLGVEDSLHARYRFLGVHK